MQTIGTRSQLFLFLLVKLPCVHLGMICLRVSFSLIIILPYQLSKALNGLLFQPGRAGGQKESCLMLSGCETLKPVNSSGQLAWPTAGQGV